MTEEMKRGPGRPPNASREPMHAEMRSEQHRAVHEEPRTRRGNRAQAHDQFHIDPSKIPPGLSLNWKVQTVAGQEQSAIMQSYLEDGWRPVDASLIPGVMPDGYKGPIQRGGQVLMERPSHLTKEAEDEAYREARQQFNSQQERAGRTPAGHFSRSHPELRSGIKVDRSIVSMDGEMAIPE